VINLKIFPQTALLFLVDALRSTGNTYKLDLYVTPEQLGGALFQLDPDLAGQGKLLFAENDLQSLMARFVELLKQSEAGGAEDSVTSEHPADSTGVP